MRNVITVMARLHRDHTFGTDEVVKFTLTGEYIKQWKAELLKFEERGLFGEEKFKGILVVCDTSTKGNFIDVKIRHRPE